MDSSQKLDNPECLICLCKVKDHCVMSSCEHVCCFYCGTQLVLINL